MSSLGRVLVVGAGGLGSPAALALAQAGVALTIVDSDRVELSNLHRQLLHGEADLGRLKAESAVACLARRGAAAEGLCLRLGEDNATDLFGEHDLVLEGSDSIETKFLVSDAAARIGRPAVIGGVVRFSGQILTVLPGGPCYRCLFEEPPPAAAPACQDVGVLGPACGVIGALMADEALRVLGGRRPRYAGAVLVADLRGLRLRRVPLSRRADCPACAPCAT